MSLTYGKAGRKLTMNDPDMGNWSYAYDALDRLTSASASGGTSGTYSETYAYDPATGSLSTKGGVTYAYSPSHAHAVASLSNGNTYTYDANACPEPAEGAT